MVLGDGRSSFVFYTTFSSNNYLPNQMQIWKRQWRSRDTWYMKKMGSCVLVKLLIKKSCILAFKPIFLIESQLYFQRHKANAFKSTEVSNQKKILCRTILRHFTITSAWTILICPWLTISYKKINSTFIIKM